MAFNRPSDADYKSVVNYVEKERPLCKDDESWIYHKEDIITLRAGREHAWLDNRIERALKCFHCKLIDLCLLLLLPLHQH